MSTTPAAPAAPAPGVIRLPRGGYVVNTSIGPIQFGMPPETIKDHMALGLEIPAHYIVPTACFNRAVGPTQGINVAEFEFPAYCNFFFKQRQVNLICTTERMETRIRQVFQETLFGPEVRGAGRDIRLLRLLRLLMGGGRHCWE